MLFDAPSLLSSPSLVVCILAAEITLQLKLRTFQSSPLVWYMVHREYENYTTIWFIWPNHFFSLFTVGLQLKKERGNHQLDDLAPEKPQW
jgi:hypothetical protein